MRNAAAPHAFAALIAVLMSVCAARPALAQESLLPPGPGRAEVIAACSDCHGISAVLYSRMTAQEWQDTVVQMQLEGSNIIEKNIPLMVQYLTAHFGPQDQPAAPPASTGAAK